VRRAMWTAPDGIETFYPWDCRARVRETDWAFLLIDQEDTKNLVLLKRGLENGDLFPAPREFLSHSVSPRPGSGRGKTAG
jgi:hypothetical protein